MKKVFLAIAVASVFTACNNGGESTETKTDTTKAPVVDTTKAPVVDTTKAPVADTTHKMAADTTKKAK